MANKRGVYNAEYGGIKTTHSGGWSAQDYHDHNKAHPDKLRQTSEERAMKPRPRPNAYEKPKPTTKVFDLSTGKSKDIQDAVDKDLKKRNLKR